MKRGYSSKKNETYFERWRLYSENEKEIERKRCQWKSMKDKREVKNKGTKYNEMKTQKHAYTANRGRKI